MKQPPHLHGTEVRRGLARDLDGTRRLSRSAASARHTELERLLAFAVERRLRRARGLPRTAAPAPRTAAPVAETPAATADGPVLLSRTAVTGDLLRLTVSRPAGFQYRPGQHVKMGLPGLLRSFSLVSAPHQPHLEFFVEIHPGGRLSERLRALRPDEWMALGDRAKGDLQLDPAFPNQLLIATVTGIAPYVSLLRDHVHSASDSPERLIVLHGASFADEFGYREELAALADRWPDRFVYLPTVSRPENARNAGWTGARGRVESQVEAVLGRFGLTPGDTAAFACGHPEMVRNVAGDLRRRGFTTQTEPFD